MSPRREQSSFSTSSIFRALGVRSPRQLPLDTGEASPVVVVADLSSTFAPEQIEARGLHMFVRTAGVPQTYSQYNLHARSEGGLVVESLAIGSDVAGRGFVQVITTPSAGMTTSGQPLPIGGSAISSFLTHGFGAGAAGNSAIFPLPFILPTERLYVPAGSYLNFGTIISPAAVHDIEDYLVFREIPEILGGP